VRAKHSNELIKGLLASITILICFSLSENCTEFGQVSRDAFERLLKVVIKHLSFKLVHHHVVKKFLDFDVKFIV
jgi:hypothetical protein